MEIRGLGIRGSKKFAEKAGESLSRMCFRMRGGLAELGTVAWDFIEREKPNFDLVTLCPPMIYGPLQHTITKTGNLNQSNSRIYDLFIKSSKDAEVPPNGLYLYVDVRVDCPP